MRVLLQLFCFAVLLAGTTAFRWPTRLFSRDSGKHGAGDLVDARDETSSWRAVLKKTTREEQLCCAEILLEEGGSLAGGDGTYLLPRYCRENNVGCPTLGFVAEDAFAPTTRSKRKESESCPAAAGCSIADRISLTTTEEETHDESHGPAQDADEARRLVEHIPTAAQGHEGTVDRAAGLAKDFVTLKRAAAAEMKRREAELAAVCERAAAREAHLISDIRRLQEAGDAGESHQKAEMGVAIKKMERDDLHIRRLKTQISEQSLAIRRLQIKAATDRFDATSNTHQAELASQGRDQYVLVTALLVLVLVAVWRWFPGHPRANTRLPVLDARLGGPKYLTSGGANPDVLQRIDGGGEAGGFAEVTFWKTASGQEFALKIAKDTVAGRRQQEREIEFLVHFSKISPEAPNIVRVVETRTAPSGMLLMHKEPQTLPMMLEEASSVNVGAVTKVLSGVLNAIDVLDVAGFIQRDVKGENILVGRNGEGVLADFGLCVEKTEASAQRELFGNGTPEYSAPEVSGGRSGSSLCTELYSVSVVFVESVLGRHPFCGKELFGAKEDRLEYLEEKRLDLLEALEEDAQDELGSAGDLESVRIQEWRLGVCKGREWRPNEAAKKLLAELGNPLGVFRRSSKRNEENERMASEEAKRHVAKVFEGDDWVDWLPGPSRAESRQGVKTAVDFLLQKGALCFKPDQRPQTVAGARAVLAEAAAGYEECRVAETRLEQRSFGTEPVEEAEPAGG